MKDIFKWKMIVKVLKSIIRFLVEFLSITYVYILISDIFNLDLKNFSLLEAIILLVYCIISINIIDWAFEDKEK